MNVMQYYLYRRYHCLVCNYHNKWYDVLHFLTIIVIFPLEIQFGNKLDVINIAISFRVKHVNIWDGIYIVKQPIYWPTGKSKYWLSVEVKHWYQHAESYQQI